jgi:hypothetical protein
MAWRASGSVVRGAMSGQGVRGVHRAMSVVLGPVARLRLHART